MSQVKPFQKGTSFLYITIVVTFTLMFALACERNTKINLERTNPPQFTLAGTGELWWIELKDVAPSEVSIYAPERIIWRIRPSAQKAPWRMPSITYGVVPPGFVQEIPALGAPPPLLEDRPYLVSAPTSYADGDSMIFIVRGDRTLRVLPTHNGEYHLETSDVFK